MAPISATSVFRSRFPLPCLVLVLVGLALPRAALPSGSTFGCALVAWGLFVLALSWPANRARPWSQLGSAAALTALAGLDPPVWLATSATLVTVLLVSPAELIRGRYWLLLGVGVLGPALLYAGLLALGDDQRVAIRLAFRVRASSFELASLLLALSSLASSTVMLVLEVRGAKPELASTRRASIIVARFLALLVCVVLVLRLAFIVSVATLRTDLMIWSESPALVNLLKLHNHELFYGPMTSANSYSYSPGLELTQYALLRPFGLELSLRAHRALGLLWQVSSALVLSLSLWPWLRLRLRGALGVLAYPLLLVGLASVTLANLLAPHVHPDHLLLLCFCGAIALCLRARPFLRRDWVMLALLPMAATVFKLTGAGVGLGLVLVALFERRFRALGVLVGSGLLALLTVPLFDSTLGSFSAYAVRLQASHAMEWCRIEDVPHTASGLIFEVAVLAVGAGQWVRPRHASVQAASRVLLLTLAVTLTSIVAFLKHGGRENSLLPLALGGAVAVLVLFGDPPGAPASAPARGLQVASASLLAVLFWVALSSSWPVAPITGEPRQRLIATHEREVSFLKQFFSEGKRPWSQGTAAWLDAGRRDTPRDRLSSLSELELGHSPALGASEARLLHGEYDALFLSASALSENDFFRRLRPQLERSYRLTEPQQSSVNWSSGRESYVILERR